MKSVLLIQTAFLGDAILSTSLLETLSHQYPEASFYVLTRKGHEPLFQYHPKVKKVWSWNKAGTFQKYVNLLNIVLEIRSLPKFDLLVNLQRFFSTGFVSLLVRARDKLGFTQNPLSTFFTHKIPFQIQSLNEDGTLKHEVQRNYELLRTFDTSLTYKQANELRPKIYFGNALLDSTRIDFERQNIILAPASVWTTKEWPEAKWRDFILELRRDSRFSHDLIYIVGAKEDIPKAKRIQESVEKVIPQSGVQILAGKQSIVQTMMMMKKVKFVVANDSAPIHMASAMNTPTLAIFCSTLPEFGFYPLAQKSLVWEVKNLACRSCGNHGRDKCPLIHFACAPLLPSVQLLDTLLS